MKRVTPAEACAASFETISTVPEIRALPEVAAVAFAAAAGLLEAVAPAAVHIGAAIEQQAY